MDRPAILSIPRWNFEALTGLCRIPVFRVDKPFVRKLAHRIEKEGFRVWLDEKKIVAGDALGKTISEALDRASVVLVVVSKASAESRWLSFELKPNRQCSRTAHRKAARQY